MIFPSNIKATACLHPSLSQLTRQEIHGVLGTIRWRDLTRLSPPHVRVRPTRLVSSSLGVFSSSRVLAIFSSSYCCSRWHALARRRLKSWQMRDIKGIWPKEAACRSFQKVRNLKTSQIKQCPPIIEYALYFGASCYCFNPRPPCPTIACTGSGGHRCIRKLWLFNPLSFNK